MTTTHKNSGSTANVTREKRNGKYGYWITGGNNNGEDYLGSSREESATNFNYHYCPEWTNPFTGEK